jgi:hypothetical protein
MQTGITCQQVQERLEETSPVVTIEVTAVDPRGIFLPIQST